MLINSEGGEPGRALLLRLLRNRERGLDPASDPSFREAEPLLARLASVSPGAPLRGQVRHPRRRTLGAALGEEKDLRRIAGLRAAGVLGEARFRTLMVEWFLTHPRSVAP